MKAIEYTKCIGGIDETCYALIHPTNYTREGDKVIINLYTFRTQALALEHDISKAVCHNTAKLDLIGTDEFNPNNYITAAIAKFGEGLEVTLS
jgi:hypothetical protein